ncbi:MAG TPA: nitroreductase [Flavobacteriaceae bacterium]|nr:nitroreductase [Flavobacteriaceae bacterium]
MLKKIIENRRAVYPRQYNKEDIKKEEIEKILESSNWAPTHRRTEPWRFKIIRGEKLTEFGEFLAERYKATAKKFSDRKYKETKAKVERSGAVILICMQRDPKERVPEWEEIASTAIAVQNMWLTASEMKIGSYWSSPDLKDEVDKFVDLKDGERCLGFFYMGRYDGELPEGTRETSWEEKVEWIE